MIKHMSEFLANSSSEMQAELLNEFGKRLYIGCGTFHKHEMQLAYIVDHIDGSGIRFIEELHGMIQTIKEEKKSAKEYEIK
jgi:hypothetical protein